MHNTQCTVHTWRSTIHNAKYTIHNTQYTVHNTQYMVHSTTQCTLHFTALTVRRTQYTMHSMQYTIHSTRYTKSNTQYTMNRVAAAHASYGLTVHINGLPPDMDRLNRVTVARTLSRLTDVPYKWTSSRNGLTGGPYILTLFPNCTHWRSISKEIFPRNEPTDGQYIRIFSRNGPIDNPYMDFMPEKTIPTIHIWTLTRLCYPCGPVAEIGCQRRPTSSPPSPLMGWHKYSLGNSLPQRSPNLACRTFDSSTEFQKLRMRQLLNSFI